MTARSPWMTGLGCLALLVSLWAGLASWVVMRRRMLGLRRTDAVTPGQKALLLCLAIPVILLISLATIERTAPQVNLGSRTNLFGDLFDLAPIVLAGDALVERPDGWLPYDIHRDVFAASWCRREAPACRSSHGEDYTSAAPQPETLGPKNDTAAPAAGFPEALEQEWRLRRLSEIARLAKPRFNPITPELWDTLGDDAISLFRRPPDLREANLRDVHMPGINLIRADLGEATLLGAEMERATLIGGSLDNAVLIEAQLRDARLWNVDLSGSDLSLANLAGAELIQASMHAATARGARMDMVNLGTADLTEADFSGASLEHAKLWRALMDRSDLSRARMNGAVLDYSLLQGTPEKPNRLSLTNLSSAVNDGGALRWLDMSEVIFDPRTDFRNAFLDGSVEMTDAFAAQMSADGEEPCQWQRDREITDSAEFYGLWRAWVEKGTVPWLLVAPRGWRDVDPIDAFPKDCEWARAPLQAHAPN